MSTPIGPGLAATSGRAGSASPGAARVSSADEVAAAFDGARRVVIVPGYGMAVSHAQHTVRDLAHLLEARGVEVEFGVHAVAGRMPGHMNVLLAEADIPYEQLKGTEDINPTFLRTDVAVVVGANDVVNPRAAAHPSGPLAGLETLAVDRARRVIVVKRGHGSGYAGVPNPLFSADNTLMLLGDGKRALLELIAALVRKKPRTAERRVGTVTQIRQISPLLGMFRMMPAQGTRFPDYRPGQYIALRRDDCRLTKRVLDAEGKPHYIPDLDERGVQKRGSVAHSYSIASAPYETQRDGHLEFYVVLEEDEWQYPGRLTDSLFRLRLGQDDKVSYVDRIAGDFTLEKRAAGCANVLMVGTGTGLAPFASMIKQLHHDAVAGAPPPARYTLFHANRSPAELAYHDELRAIEAAGAIDFVYVASVSRPDPGDAAAGYGHGRANNLLRQVLGMPLREQEALQSAGASDGNSAAARAELAKAVRPRLADHLDPARLRERITTGATVVLSCGNPGAMDDVRRVAESHGMRFEKEDWKLAPRATRPPA